MPDLKNLSQRWEDLTPADFGAWKQHPMTALIMRFMEDKIVNYRDLAADLVEAGAFQVGARPEVNNPDVLRGRILALRELHALDIGVIQGFYREASAVIDSD